MALDSRKFIAVADGSEIRLFPENYGIMNVDRESSGRWWKLDIDLGVPLELAMQIFREYHTSADVRWGDKSKVLRELNALLEDPVVEMEDTDWELEEVRCRYHIWSRWSQGREIFQATPSCAAPTNNAGYSDRAALLHLKGIH